jgi:hypothetical protein
MKLETIVEQLVKQELRAILSEKSEPEAPKNAEFGEYLFGDRRRDAPAKDESNTKKEWDFDQALYSHIVNNYSSPLVKIIPKLVQLKNQGKYSKYLEPPPGLVYRFVSDLSPERAALMLGIELSELKKHRDTVTSTEDIPHSYTPRKHIASWTTNPEKLKNSEFAQSPYEGKVVVLLVADTSTSGEFLLNPTNLKKVVDDNSKRFLNKENEVISAGEVQIVRASFLYKTNYDPYPNLGTKLISAVS